MTSIDAGSSQSPCRARSSALSCKTLLWSAATVAAGTHAGHAAAQTHIQADALDQLIAQLMVPAQPVAALAGASRSSAARTNRPQPIEGAVEGDAQAPARVEVRQGDRTLASTIVPAGPFRLERLMLADAEADIVVTVHENGGTLQRFIVTAHMARDPGNLMAPAEGQRLYVYNACDPIWQDASTSVMAAAPAEPAVSAASAATLLQPGVISRSQAKPPRTSARVSTNVAYAMYASPSSPSSAR